MSDLLDFVSHYVNLHKVKERFVGLCPFHNEKTPSFVVDVPKDEWYCFGCRRRGTLKDFIELLENAKL